MINDFYADMIDHYITEANSPLGIIKFCYDVNKNSSVCKLYQNKTSDNGWVILFSDLSGIAVIFYKKYYALFKLFVDDLEYFLKFFDQWDVINNAEN